MDTTDATANPRDPSLAPKRSLVSNIWAGLKDANKTSQLALFVALVTLIVTVVQVRYARDEAPSAAPGDATATPPPGDATANPRDPSLAPKRSLVSNIWAGLKDANKTSQLALFVALVTLIVTVVQVRYARDEVRTSLEMQERAKAKAEVHAQVYFDSQPLGIANVGDRVVEATDQQNPVEISSVDIRDYGVTLQVSVDNTGGQPAQLRNFDLVLGEGYLYSANRANSYEANQVEPMYCEVTFADRAPCVFRLPHSLQNSEALLISANLNQWYTFIRVSRTRDAPLRYRLNVQGYGLGPLSGEVPVVFRF